MPFSRAVAKLSGAHTPVRVALKPLGTGVSHPATEFEHTTRLHGGDDPGLWIFQRKLP